MGKLNFGWDHYDYSQEPKIKKIKEKRFSDPEICFRPNLIYPNDGDTLPLFYDSVSVTNPYHNLTGMLTDYEDDESNIKEDLNDEDWDDIYESKAVYEPKKENTFQISSEKNLLEAIIDQINDLDLKSWEKSVAEEIIYNLDDSGYLSIDILLIADRFEKTEDEINHILRKVQHLDPPALASRDLQQCLMIQLDNNKDSIEYKIVKQYFNDFINKRYNRISKRGDISSKELSGAIENLSKLNPKPGLGLQVSKDESIIPDLILNKRSNQWEITVNDSWIPPIHVSKTYKKMLNDLETHNTKTKKFLKNNFNKAEWVIGAIDQRRTTLYNVMKQIINHQPAFFDGNIDKLTPMRLKDISDIIGLDISTVSRATRGKYVETPYGIFELKYFFTDNHTLFDGVEISVRDVKLALKKIIDNEDKNNPLSDDDLMEALKHSGYSIARRTVTKYRDKLNLPNARLRRKI